MNVNQFIQKSSLKIKILKTLLYEIYKFKHESNQIVTAKLKNMISYNISVFMSKI